MPPNLPAGAEAERLEKDARREPGGNWKRWGPYLSERQWGTVREDYSADGNCWDYFTHDQSRSRAYRWGEDGLLGICDRECRLCFAVALWNGKDPILKERLFGLTGPEGNHGEDVKECYYYLDSTPTHSYLKALYKYPQGEFPYAKLVEENRRRNRSQPEFEIEDTGIFNEDRYFDVTAEYAKNAPDDILIRLTVANRGPGAATIHLLPTLWCRNSWSWGCEHEGCELKPFIRVDGPTRVDCDHATLGRFCFEAEPLDDKNPQLLFTENESNLQRLFGAPNNTPFVKDAFHEYVIRGNKEAVNPQRRGTKVAAHYELQVPAGKEVVVRLRLWGRDLMPDETFGKRFDETFRRRREEANEFFTACIPQSLSSQQQQIARQAYAGMLWSKQFYHYVVKSWLEGDPWQPPPPPSRKNGRNSDWTHLFNRDVISMPDKWEYPWYAAWDLAFHMIPFARLDPQFAKEQLVLFLREWYMHPNGQLPAYEFQFSDVNPPVHAWACWRVYKMTGQKGQRDRVFLARVFHKLLINFTWWVNRKDPTGRNIFSGGFLGLDNIGVFDRSKPLPTGGSLEQADGTAWMGFYCATMLAMALELASEEPAYEDVASKFFEHFVSIADAVNTLGGTGLWDDTDGFYYDQIRSASGSIPLRVRSLVGLVPLFTAEVLESEVIDRLPGFKKRMQWFLEHRSDLGQRITYMDRSSGDGKARRHYLLAIPSRERLERLLRYVFDENEFLSPYGIRSLSKVHEKSPFILWCDGSEYRVDYTPGESRTDLFGGNSNWRGPVWFPVNYLLVEVLQRYHYFYGDALQVEFPTGSGNRMNLKQVSALLSERLTQLFVPDAQGRRPCHGGDERYATDSAWKDLVLFHEYFHGDNGRGCGANHQTGWTGLVAALLHSIGTGSSEIAAKPDAAAPRTTTGARAAIAAP